MMHSSQIYSEWVPAHWAGDYPNITIHYREGDEPVRDILMQGIQELLRKLTEGVRP